MLFSSRVSGVVFAGAIAAFCASSQASATVIDFAPLGENVVVTDQFASDGVTFSGWEDGALVPIVTANFVSATGDTYFSNCYPARCDSRADILRIEFDGPVGDVSFVLDTEGGLNVTFQAFDAGGTMLEFIHRTGNGVIFSLASSGISRIDVLQPTESWGWGLADLTFTPSDAVPEPAMLGLFGLGLIGIGAARRRRTKR
jgi:hypothetical protein